MPSTASFYLEATEFPVLQVTEYDLCCYSFDFIFVSYRRNSHVNCAEFVSCFCLEGSTKIVDFMTPGAGVLVLGRGHIIYIEESNRVHQFVLLGKSVNAVIEFITLSKCFPRSKDYLVPQIHGTHQALTNQNCQVHCKAQHSFSQHSVL